MDKIITTDFGLTITLMCYGATVDCLNEIDPGKYEFVIIPGHKTNQEFIDGYYMGKIRVEPKKFMSNQKILKSMIRPKLAFHSGGR